MTKANLIGSAAIVAAIVIGAAPVSAQQGQRGGFHRGGHAASGQIGAGPMRGGRQAIPRATVPPRARVTPRVNPHFNRPVPRVYGNRLAPRRAFPYYRSVDPFYRSRYPFYGSGYPFYPYRSVYPLYGSVYPFYGGGYPIYQDSYRSYSYDVAPSDYGAPYGGVRLDIDQPQAEVYADGVYAGLVDDFNGTSSPLLLEPGTHRIEVRAPGFEPLTFDVNVARGQDVVYRRTLQPASP